MTSTNAAAGHPQDSATGVRDAATESATGAAARATYVAFVGAGFAFASWAARIPQVKSQLGLDPAQLGVLLLFIALGSVLALPMSGLIVTALGSGRTVQLAALVLALGLAVVSVGELIGVAPVAAGLFVFGFGLGTWDVAMNVHGALVEQRLGRAIMPRFHAGFSLGTVTGALLGAGLVALGVPVTAHLLGVAAVIALGVPMAVRGFVADTPAAGTRSGEPSAGLSTGSQPVDARPAATCVARARALLPAHWREPRTLAIGMFVLSFAFAEGTGNDWITVALVEGHHASAVLATLGFAVFLTAMTAGRWFGPALLDRFGRIRVVRMLAVLGVGGVALFVYGGGTAVAFGGAVIWGLGVSLGFPVGMSAAADDPVLAAARVSTVASIGYVAFLAGPPLVGVLGDRPGVLGALMSVAVLLGASVLLARSVRPLPAAAIS